MSPSSVLRCDACNGFVGRVPYRARVLRVVEASSQADEDNAVSPCIRCRKLNEIERLPDLTPDARAA